MEKIIEINHLTKDYGENRGVFDISLDIYKGEMVGFMGTNGSGKTTTIREILGYIKPTSGETKVKGITSWGNSNKFLKEIGYVPGEIGFPDLKTGTEFIKSQAEFYNLKDLSYANELIEKLQLDPKANLKRMSKGMKQKTALVAALMANQEIIILDEPTTGLDPLMRDAFLSIIKEEHKKGKTIFMSSHMFNELETTCDKVAMIDKGKIVDVVDMNTIKNRPIKEYKVEFIDRFNYIKFKENEKVKILRDQEKYNQLTIEINKTDLKEFFNILKNYQVKFISENKYNLEKYFMDKLHKEENKND